MKYAGDSNVGYELGALSQLCSTKRRSSNPKWLKATGLGKGAVRRHTSFVHYSLFRPTVSEPSGG